MIAALLMTDPSVQRRWLAFPRPPPEELRKRLLSAGWRYHGGHRAWHQDNPTAPIPAGFAVALGGECAYSVARSAPAFFSITTRLRAVVASPPSPATAHA
jgi:hypothetical protein